jgi:hypothetical protein
MMGGAAAAPLIHEDFPSKGTPRMTGVLSLATSKPDAISSLL